METHVGVRYTGCTMARAATVYTTACLLRLLSCGISEVVFQKLWAWCTVSRAVDSWDKRNGWSGFREIFSHSICIRGDKFFMQHDRLNLHSPAIASLC